MSARLLELSGRVQGVGFRPFVYRQAHHHGLSGWVRNELGRVQIHVQGDAKSLDAFVAELIDAAPPLARPTLLSDTPVPAERDMRAGEFRILVSNAGSESDIHVPPDQFTCDECLAELLDPADRRHHYPFINCTQCGPRYTLITALPYDRANTTMRDFVLCPACRDEYENPLDRRFHAEPVACPECGPSLSFIHRDQTIALSSQAMEATITALRDGAIVAVKGIGGYHLMCDAENESAVSTLRRRKPRPHKPLAVMVPWRGMDGLDMVRTVAAPNAAQASLLTDPMRPIVLVPEAPDSTLAADIAPGLDEIGIMLPYSPLHHLLSEAFGGPLVATSGNLSGEPVLTENIDAQTRLAHVADAWLHHNRPIRRPADDAVYREIGGHMRPLRLGRGNAPLEITLPFEIAMPALAVGGHMKNTVALAWRNRVVVSPHIGELSTPRGMDVFGQVCEDLQHLYNIHAERIICDAHPHYGSTRWALRDGRPVDRVWHHHAHASALAGEMTLTGPMLVFTWDGTGYGEDGTQWGGEALLGSPGAWRRVASFRQFRPPGGDKAGRDPWRSAAALCWEAGHPWRNPYAENVQAHAAWEQGINCPVTSAVGRLFDAAAALTGLVINGSFEGHGPMFLEAIARADGVSVPLPLTRDEAGIWRSDWTPLLPMLTDETRPATTRAADFHATLAQTLVDQAECIHNDSGVDRVGLSGGVFQNRLLTELAIAKLTAAGFAVHLHTALPCNDAGISFGQIIETALRENDE